MTAGVSLQGLSKSFGPVEAVRGLTLDIDEGEFFSLLGPSGCGKTTTLRLVAGFEEPTAGRIFIGDREVTQTPAHKRPVNTVFQSYALFPHLNVAENVAFGLRFKDVRTREELVIVGGEVAAEAEAVLVARDPETRRPRPLTDDERSRLEAGP